jgi:hypothetical protein
MSTKLYCKLPAYKYVISDIGGIAHKYVMSDIRCRNECPSSEMYSSKPSIMTKENMYRNKRKDLSKPSIMTKENMYRNKRKDLSKLSKIIKKMKEK